MQCYSDFDGIFFVCSVDDDTFLQTTEVGAANNIVQDTPSQEYEYANDDVEEDEDAAADEGLDVEDEGFLASLQQEEAAATMLRKISCFARLGRRLRLMWRETQNYVVCLCLIVAYVCVYR
jgi:hypothetical protein